MAIHNDRILLIDDDDNLRKTLGDILRMKGYEVLLAKDGREGLERQNEKPVNLVLVDLHLPDMSGLDVIRRIKDGSPLTEAIILTGNASLYSAIEATESGAFFYLTKPYDIDQLLLQVNRAIDKGRAAKELLLSRKMLEDVTQGIDESILLITRDYRILWANRAALMQTALTMEEIVGNCCYVVTHRQQSPCHSEDDPCPVQQLLATGKTVTVQHLHVDAKGVTHFVEIDVYPVKNNEGEITEIVHVSRDITERVRMEKELAEKVAELEATLSRVKQLEGIIPICMYCKKIRDDQEIWQQLETYISQHSEAFFSHGICPDCFEKKIREIDDMKKR